MTPNGALRATGTLAAAVALVLLAACSRPDAPEFGVGTLEIAARGGSVGLQVEVARTEGARRVGLMDRSSLAPDAGMVFVYKTPTRRPFWMKDTFIELSIAFWDESGTIVAIMHMAPCRADPCRLYTPPASYVGAVEANSGFFAQHGISVGDRVLLLP